MGDGSRSKKVQGDVRVCRPGQEGEDVISRQGQERDKTTLLGGKRQEHIFRI